MSSVRVPLNEMKNVLLNIMSLSLTLERRKALGAFENIPATHILLHTSLRKHIYFK